MIQKSTSLKHEPSLELLVVVCCLWFAICDVDFLVKDSRVRVQDSGSGFRVQGASEGACTLSQRRGMGTDPGRARLGR